MKYIIESISNAIIFILLVVIILLFFYFIFAIGIPKMEKVECYKWQQMAKEYEGFYLKQWQAEQCQHYHIKVDAPIK